MQLQMPMHIPSLPRKDEKTSGRAHVRPKPLRGPASRLPGRSGQAPPSMPPTCSVSTRWVAGGGSEAPKDTFRESPVAAIWKSDPQAEGQQLPDQLLFPAGTRLPSPGSSEEENGGVSSLIQGQSLCQFRGAATTKCHKLGTPDSRNVISYSSGGQKSKIKLWEGPQSLWKLQGRPLPACSSLWSSTYVLLEVALLQSAFVFTQPPPLCLSPLQSLLSALSLDLGST